MLDAVKKNRSVLVEGPGGSGKSVLVQTVLNDTEKRSECVTVFMGEQVDSKVGRNMRASGCLMGS